jgi:hypothetical protein
MYRWLGTILPALVAGLVVSMTAVPATAFTTTTRATQPRFQGSSPSFSMSTK